MPMILEKILSYLIVFFMTPTYFIFMMTIVRQAIVDTYQIGIGKHIFHIVLSLYFFINVAGNMLMSITTETKVEKSPDYELTGQYCSICKLYSPARSWHCRRCNICILKRDHHCYIFSKCIGLNNLRYYTLYLVHLAVSMFYSTYYTYYFVSMKFEKDGVALFAFRIVNPFLRYLANDPWSVRDLYVLFLFMNTSLIFWSLCLLRYLYNNLKIGVTAYEARDKTLCDKYKSDFKTNVLNVFGEKWYLTFLWPFVDSPLPNGTHYRGVLNKVK